ncbi:MAG: hypothetical protein PHG66_03430 [Candidatus Colwellbacteria bacterium]|nr:hypothetical protein [Candidatus Colwellbacteria bacterium]
MKLWSKILIVLLTSLGAVLALMYIKEPGEPKNVDGSASVGRSFPQITEKATQDKLEGPELDGFYGIEDEIDALSGSM